MIDKSYLDKKIELIVETLGAPVDHLDLSKVIEDLHRAYADALRRRNKEGQGVFRIRCKTLIIGASRAKKMVKGGERETCADLEDRILRAILDKENDE